PHTAVETTADDWKPGVDVNLEVDVIARYLERLLMGEKAAQSGGGITLDFLAEHGFVK
ncbi:MAG TPA: riboflavin synthase, partial [Pseudomonadales bacterium]|nr:riboflavin synthase [Pseudomonadales bacterium]